MADQGEGYSGVNQDWVWLDHVEDDLRMIGVRGWRPKAEVRHECQHILGEAKVQLKDVVEN